MKEGQDWSRYPNLIRALAKESDPGCNRGIWERFQTQTHTQVDSGIVKKKVTSQ